MIEDRYNSTPSAVETLPVGAPVEAFFYGEWHSARARRHVDGRIEVHWDVLGS